MLRDAVVSGWMMPRHLDGDSVPVDRDAVRKELEEYSAAWDIIRGWCGAAAVEAFDELSDLRADYERLQRVLDETARWLKDAGHPVKQHCLGDRSVTSR